MGKFVQQDSSTRSHFGGESMVLHIAINLEAELVTLV